MRELVTHLLNFASLLQAGKWGPAPNYVLKSLAMLHFSCDSLTMPGFDTPSSILIFLAIAEAVGGDAAHLKLVKVGCEIPGKCVFGAFVEKKN